MTIRDIRGLRAPLALVPDIAAEPPELATFCSNCGTRSGQEPDIGPRSRVCSDCGLGIVLETRADCVPEAGAAFVVLDGSLSVCAVSAAAEELLATSETDAVNRHVTELLVPANVETARAGPSNLASAVTWAASGDDAVRTVTVRPANVFGVRLTARITSCSPPRAALLVFDGP
jgi:hypothetical protein